MPFGCSASLRSLSCCLQFLLIPHGSYCVLHATSFITSFVPLHYTTFAAKPFCCKAGHPKPHTKQYTWDAPAFSQAIPAILTGFHSASLRHSFTSVAFSPPAALFSFARRQPHLGCVHLATANCSCRTSISQSIAKVHLHSSATCVPCGKYTSVASYGAAIAPANRGFTASPFVGARRPPPLRRTSLFRRPSNGSLSLQCGQVCRTATLLFCRRRFYRKS